MKYIQPDWGYVNKQLMYWRELLRVRHEAIEEIEALRNLEDNPKLQEGESITGQKVRVGLTAELIENVKAALVSNMPVTHFDNHRKGESGGTNASDRERFWNEVLKFINHPTPVLDNWVDATAGLGYGILKCAKVKWPEDDMIRRPRESAKEHLDRVKGYKKRWGPPIGAIDIHPLNFFFDPTATIAGKITECIEHSYKPKNTVFGEYSLWEDSDLAKSVIPTLGGQPDSYVRPLPRGLDTATMVLVTEYWNPEWYQVYINGRLIFDQSPPEVCYFVCPGRTTSSHDPDKFGLSVAENLRKNEPIINRNLTRLFEANELVVNKRLTITLPEGSIDGVVTDPEGNITTRSFVFKQGEAEALPAGAKPVDPFQGVENAFSSLPIIQLLMGITAQWGVSPIFKGIPPGAAGSGYRDNSLYTMAKSQFNYLLNNLNYTLAMAIDWFEQLITTCIDQEVYVGELSLKPAQIKDWPCTISAEFKPVLPMNFIAEGEFGARMNATKLLSKERVRYQFLGIEDPESEEDALILEAGQEILLPVLLNDVVRTVLGSAATMGETASEGSDLGSMTPDEMRNSNMAGMGARGVLAGQQAGSHNGLQGVGRDMGRSIGGRVTGGHGRNPEIQPGGTQ